MHPYQCLGTRSNSTFCRLLLLLQNVLTNTNWLFVIGRVRILLVIPTRWSQDEALGFCAFDPHLGDVEDLALLGLGFGANAFVFLYSVRSEIAAAQ